MLGTVKFFHADRGWGFIEGDGFPVDIFVHHSAIVMSDYRELNKNQRVEFRVEDTDKGPIAFDVVPIKPTNGRICP